MSRRVRRQSKADEAIQFNRQAVDALKAINPDAAGLLQQRGISLGWWNTVQHFWITKRTPEEAAEAVSKQHAKEFAA